jgi:hypothetical protein
MTTRNSTAQLSPERKPAPDSSYSLPLAWRLGLSAAVLWHVLAVFLPAMRSACGWDGFSSPLVDIVIRPFDRYIGAMYLDHGYSFFAPDPGASHLVRYKVEFADGRAPVEGIFPNLKEEQPRLKYHRHFMISESYFRQFESPNPPPEPSPPPLNAQPTERERLIQQDRKAAHDRELAVWKHRRAQYDAMTTSMEKHLLKEYGGSKVTLTRVEHRVLNTYDVTELGMTSQDPSTYVNLSENPPATAREDLP